MTYARSAFGPGSIATLSSGIGLTRGPTIGSTSRQEAIALGGLGVIARARTDYISTATAAKVVPVVSRITAPIGRIFDGGSFSPNMTDTNYVDIASEETPVEDELVVQGSSGVSPWVWVVGGIFGLGLIGGLAWWALK